MEAYAGGDSELISRTLQVEHKLFYLDLKENSRGRYLKISEKTTASRSTIIVPLAGVVWFVDLFNYYANGDEPELSSKELQLDTKVFYFDVGQNNRGRFLKVSEASVARNRSTIIVPAGASGVEGWMAFRNILVEIHEATQLLATPKAVENPTQNATQHPFQHPPQHSPHHSMSQPGPIGGLSSHHLGTGFLPPDSKLGTQNSQSSPQVPDISNLSISSPSQESIDGNTTTRTVRAGQKRFFFDLGSNTRGQYLKISEVMGLDRSSIILPASAIEQFHDTLGHFLELTKSLGMPTNGNVRTIASPRKRTES